MSGSMFSVSLMPLVKIVESCGLHSSVVAWCDEGNVKNVGHRKVDMDLTFDAGECLNYPRPLLCC